MKKLLWVGDAVVSTGFARATHKTLDGFVRAGWKVFVLGLNYMGDPHEYPYAIYPCYPGGDAFGVRRIRSLVDVIRPDAVIIQNDPWNVPAYLETLAHATVKPPIFAAMPVDGRNCRHGARLNDLTGAIFWTQFGLDEARAGGYSKSAAIIPLGVDLSLYRRIPDSRKRLGLDHLPEGSIIIGNVNRNQPRKRLDLTVRYFAEWANDYKIDDAYLLLHIAPTGDQGYDAQQLMQYYGFRGTRKRLILIEPEIGYGMDERKMPVLYSCFDIQVSTTQGEGWGLTTMEGMACQVPQLVPAWSALGEWCSTAVDHVRCSTTSVTPSRVNVIGGVPDQIQFVEKLHNLYRRRDYREALGRAGLELVSQERFRWENIATRFVEYIEGTLG